MEILNIYNVIKIKIRERKETELLMLCVWLNIYQLPLPFDYVLNHKCCLIQILFIPIDRKTQEEEEEEEEEGEEEEEEEEGEEEEEEEEEEDDDDDNFTQNMLVAALVLSLTRHSSLVIRVI